MRLGLILIVAGVVWGQTNCVTGDGKLVDCPPSLKDEIAARTADIKRLDARIDSLGSVLDTVLDIIPGLISRIEDLERRGKRFAEMETEPVGFQGPQIFHAPKLPDSKLEPRVRQLELQLSLLREQLKQIKPVPCPIQEYHFDYYAGKFICKSCRLEGEESEVK